MRVVGSLTSLHTLHVTLCLPGKQESYLLVPSAPFTQCCTEAEGARCQGAETLKAMCGPNCVHLSVVKACAYTFSRQALWRSLSPKRFPLLRLLLPEDTLLTSEEPSLRPQELAHFRRGPAGVDIFLDPVSQVKERHVGGQGKGGLQGDDRGTGLSVGRVSKALTDRK